MTFSTKALYNLLATLMVFVSMGVANSSADVILFCEETVEGMTHSCDLSSSGNTHVVANQWSVAGNLRVVEIINSGFTAIVNCRDHTGGGLIVTNYQTATGQQGNASYSAGCHMNGGADDPGLCQGGTQGGIACHRCGSDPSGNEESCTHLQ